MGRQAVAATIEEQMAAVDRYLSLLGGADALDWRNGHYPRHLSTTLGDIELREPWLFPDHDVRKRAIDLPQECVSGAGKAPEQSEIELPFAVIPSIIAG
jgi:hypothetical protein